MQGKLIMWSNKEIRHMWARMRINEGNWTYSMSNEKI